MVSGVSKFRKPKTREMNNFESTRDDKKKLTLRKLKLLFNCQYLRQFFIKLSNQGQFQNPQEKQILKLTLVVRFDKELMEILAVKEKASVFEVSTFFLSARVEN